MLYNTKLALITGVSRGLGKAFALQLMEAGYTIIGFSRHSEISLNKHHSCFYPVDLNNPKQVLEVAEPVFARLAQAPLEKVCLINNAATASPVDVVGNLKLAEFEEHLAINLTSPMVLCQLFCHYFKSIAGERRILNISSGAAQTPVPGSGSYCVSKAGLEMLTRVIATEYNQKNFFCVVVRPGIFDTEMQSFMRSQPIEKSPAVGMFQQFKKEGLLRKPEEVARQIIQKFLVDPIENGKIYNNQF